MDNHMTDFFKGRIGQAILETTLLNFGYKVERLGCEIPPLTDTDDFETAAYLPDLLVTTEDDSIKKYLEVKLRTSHPLEVSIPKAQVTMLKRDYPETLFVFVSPYNGSINCLDINDPALSEEPTDNDGHYRIELLADAWKPLWEFFPAVNKGDKTDSLWHEMKEVMEDFAASRLSHSRDTGFFAEEKDSLKTYIQNHWHPGMMAQDIKALNIDTAEIADIWEHAMSIHAFRFAFDLCGGEANMDHPAFSQVMDKLRGKIGERFITIPYQNIKEALTEYPDLYGKLQTLEEEVRNTSPYDAAVVLMEGLIEIIPQGIGTAYIMPEKGTVEEPIEVDFRTMLALMARRNCLYD